MNESQLSDLLSLGEGFTTEFKKSGTSNMGREICAFANATGGVILVGVANDGKICGVFDHNSLKSEVRTTARSAEPPIAVEVESVGDVLCVTVPEQQGKPYSFGGRFFIREGASSQQMSRDEIREFFYKEGLIHFDETACDRFDLKRDLNAEIWERFSRRARLPKGVDMLSTLQNLHLVRDGRMTHAGAWLLTNDITAISISATVTCALFRGTDKVQILDRKEYKGDLYSIYEDCMAYLQSKLNTELIPTATGREERPELPVEALREALVNAIVHRDYRSTANIQIYIFHDRVEIVAPGGLPAGMREEDLGFKSVPRNPLLFGIFQRMNLVEQIGSGIRRIRMMCRDYKVDEPVIEVSESWVTVTFRRPVMSQPESQPELQPELQPESGAESLENRIIRMLYQKSMSKSMLSSELGQKEISGQLNKVVRELMAEGYVEYTIPEKPRSRLQKYRLTEKGKKIQEKSEK
ncbi:ATP-dependent DNA helicase RecG [Methanomicrobium sp. W14]|uniref:ATP-binding protein n=1 Tax=Methanomicrobium sp. W14 TaxID=2817839 RepID=UPI001AE64D47|nr:ATP-binding protein [Methanomicrobium sp. W14]MBP2132158.1 ATP-dependent DNA helicase RecG [Methanomicrobium sp. W14]